MTITQFLPKTKTAADTHLWVAADVIDDDPADDLAVQELLAPLAPHQRDIVVGHAVCGETFDGICARYGRSDEWGRLQYKRAVATLKRTAPQPSKGLFRKNSRRPDLASDAGYFEDGYRHYVGYYPDAACRKKHNTEAYVRSMGRRPKSVEEDLARIPWEDQYLSLGESVPGEPMYPCRSLSPEDVAKEIALHPEWRVDQQVNQIIEPSLAA